MNFKEFLIEALTDKQKDIVDTWPETRAAVNISGHVIPKGQDRLTIPLEDPHDKFHIHPSDSVDMVMSHHGYSIHNYPAGLAKDKYGREVKIGKVLNDIHRKYSNKDDDDTQVVHGALQDFNKDMNQMGHRVHGDLQIVISRHPYDVAGMSTGRGWTSCMDMKNWGRMGPHNALQDDVKHGTHVAYLTKKGDDTIENPIARIALKPLKEEGSTRHILYPEEKMYGTAASAFEHTVNKWTQTHFPLKPNTFYTKHPDVYDDSHTNQRVVSDIKTITPEHIESLKIASSNPIERDNKWKKAQHVARHGSFKQRKLLFNYPDRTIQDIAKNGGW